MGKLFGRTSLLTYQWAGMTEVIWSFLDPCHTLALDSYHPLTLWNFPVLLPITLHFIAEDSSSLVSWSITELHLIYFTLENLRNLGQAYQAFVCTELLLLATVAQSSWISWEILINQFCHAYFPHHIIIQFLGYKWWLLQLNTWNI